MAARDATPLLSVRDVVRRFPERGRRWAGGPPAVPALDGATAPAKGLCLRRVALGRPAGANDDGEHEGR